jgi:hypothetical protein
MSRRRRRDLSYCTLHDLFQSIHRAAVRGLCYPLNLSLIEWLTPIVDAAAKEVYSEISPLHQKLLCMDGSLGVNFPSHSFDRSVVLLCHRPTHCWYSDPSESHPGGMSFPKFKLEIPHHQTWGKQHIMRALGRWIDYGSTIELSPSDTGIEKASFSSEMMETFDFTMLQLGHIHKELSDWYWQFSVGGDDPGRDPNTLAQGEHYHRVAAAMYYAPVVNQWAHFLHEQTTVKLAPQSQALRKNTSFRYQNAMPIELSSALQTALDLRKSMDEPKEEEDA